MTRDFKIRPDKLPRKLVTLRGHARCTCGCGGQRTSLGVQDTRVVVSGCEASVRRWIRNPADWPMRASA